MQKIAEVEAALFIYRTSWPTSLWLIWVSSRRDVLYNSNDSGDVLISAKECRRRMGNISAMTIWRWAHNPEMGFPLPKIINRRRYWLLGDIQEWVKGRSL